MTIVIIIIIILLVVVQLPQPNHGQIQQSSLHHHYRQCSSSITTSCSRPTLYTLICTSISANADGPRDAVSRKIAGSTLHASEITRQQALRAIFKAHCYTDRHLLVIGTYIHSKAQTPLGRFVPFFWSTYCTSKFARNIQEIKPMELQPQCIAVGERKGCPSSTTLLIAVRLRACRG